MEELIKILKGINPGVDFENEENLIGDELLDSFDIISIVSAIDDEFDVKISAKYVIPENFNSAKSMYALIKKIEEEEL